MYICKVQTEDDVSAGILRHCASRRTERQQPGAPLITTDMVAQVLEEALLQTKDTVHTTELALKGRVTA